MSNLTQEEAEKLKELCTDALECPRLNETELQFIGEITFKLETYWIDAYISEKQKAWLKRIGATKIYV